jgi:eukaryotic-like serine/threonine-protein kinase
MRRPGGGQHRGRNSQRPWQGDLSSVLLKAIEDHPRRRYTSVEQLSDDLRRWLAGLPVLAREQTLLYRGARFVQRHRWRVTAGALLILILSLSVLAVMREYGRERRRMAQVRNLSQSLLSDILTEVGRLPGSMKARLMIVDRARRNLDQLLPEAPGDPELRRTLAAAYLQLGDIQGRPFTVSLGDTTGAIESYRKAAALASRAAAEDWEMLAVLVRARLTIAQIEARAGQYPEAVALIRSILEPAKRLSQGAPAGFEEAGKPATAVYVEANRTLGYTMLKEGERAPFDMGRLQRILAQLESTVQIAERFQAAHPDLPDLVAPPSQLLGFALESLGNATGEDRYFREGVAAHQRTADLCCEAFRKDPTPQTQRNCSDGLGELSWALHRAGEGSAAVRTATQALTLMAPVSRAEPDSVEAQQDLIDAYLHLGAAENTAGNYMTAIGQLRTAESLLLPLLRDGAKDPLEAQGLYAHIERELGEALLAGNYAAAATQAFEMALSAAKRSPKSSYWVPYIQRELADARAARARASSR